MQAKIEEARLRRMAKRRGLTLSKSRRRDPAALDYGMYALIDNERGNPIHSDNINSIYALTLDDVREWLEVEEAEQVESLLNSSLGEPFQMEAIPRYLHKYLDKEELADFKRKPKAPPLQEVEVDLVDADEEDARIRRQIATANNEQLAELRKNFEYLRDHDPWGRRIRRRSRNGMPVDGWPADQYLSLIAEREAELSS